MRFFKKSVWKKEKHILSKRSISNSKKRVKYSLFEEFQISEESQLEKDVKTKDDFCTGFRSFQAEQAIRIRSKIPNGLIRKVFYKYFFLTGCPLDYTYFLDFLTNKCNYRDLEKIYNNE